MSEVSLKDVQDIVNRVQVELHRTMSSLANSMDRMAQSHVELTAQSKVTDEKFVRVYDHIEVAHQLARNASKNTSVNVFYILKAAVVIAVPLLGGLWAILKTQSNAQAESIKELIKLIGSS